MTRGFAYLPAIFIVIALVAAAGVGYVLVTQPFSETTNKSNSTIKSSAGTNITDTPRDWNTYTDEEFVYSIGYPSDYVQKGSGSNLEITKTTISKTGVTPTDTHSVSLQIVDLRFGSDPFYESIKTGIPGIDPPGFTNRRRITLNENTFTAFDVELGRIDYVIVKGNFAFVITDKREGNEGDATNTKIIASLKLPTQSNDTAADVNTTSEIHTSNASNTNVAINKTADWKLYTSIAQGTTFRYPPHWEVNEFLDDGGFGLRPIGKSGDWEWGVGVYEKSQITIDELIALNGNQFSDRKENRETIQLHGVSATKVTVTTAQIKDWESVEIYFEKDGKIYDIGNGAVMNPDFRTFYESYTIR